MGGQRVEGRSAGGKGESPGGKSAPGVFDSEGKHKIAGDCGFECPGD
jgi:hypothetical protein